MATYTVTLSNAQDMALSSVVASQQEWIDNFVHERCRVAIDEIVRVCVEKCLETNTPVPGSKDAMVELAFQNGWVIAAANRSAPQPIPTVDEGQ